jgi:hypothetical protein
MRIKKGKYRVAYSDGWKSEKGSYCHCYPFIIHRQADEKFWKVSHMATGYNIKRGLSLKLAKELVTRIKDYPIFLMPTIETWNQQMAWMKENKPATWQMLTHIITTIGDNRKII